MADPYKNNVVLYLPMEGSRDGDTVFLDKTGKTATRVGTPVLQGTTGVPEPFGVRHMYNPGNGSYISFAACSDFDFGAGDWTIEAWLLRASGATSDIEWIAHRHSSDANNLWAFRWTTSATLRFFARATSIITDITTTTSFSTDTWYHIAAVRRNGIVSIFVNGVSQPLTATTNLTSAYVQPNYPLVVGAADNTATGDWLGYIKDVRITKGVARYTGNFSVSQTTTVDDADWASVVLAVHGEGTGTTFTDVSNSPQTITTVGGVTHSTAIAPPFGTSSIKFDGDSDALLVATGSWWDVGTSNFTIETWIYVVAGVANSSRIFQSVNGDAVAGLYITMSQDGTLNVAASSAGSSFDVLNTSGGILSTGKWYHIAFVREGSNFNFFINGIKTFLASSSSTIYYSGSHQPVIGGQSIGTNRSLNGYLKDFRFTKGVARYTQNFNPWRVVDPYYKDTALLVSGEGSGTTFTDDSPSAKAITTNGNTTHSTAVVPPFGSSSIYFDGTGDYLALDGSASLALGTGDFTIEAWFRIATAGTFQGIYDCRTVQSSACPCVYVNSSNKILFYVNGVDRITSGTTLAANQWYHVAVVRSQGITWMYLNGVIEGSAWTDSTDYINNTARPVIGVFGDNVTTGGWAGYIKDLRITKGVARYTGNFTPAKVPALTKSGGRPTAFPDKTTIKTIAKPLDWDTPEQPRILI